jgi:hypothetical protein
MTVRSNEALSPMALFGVSLHDRVNSNTSRDGLSARSIRRLPACAETAGANKAKAAATTHVLASNRIRPHKGLLMGRPRRAGIGHRLGIDM